MKMNRINRMFTTILTYPISWLALLIVISISGAWIYWFDPPILINLSVIGTGAVLLLLWPILLIRTETFKTLYNRYKDDVPLENFRKTLGKCHPAFAKAAADCLAMVQKIQKEFEDRSFHEDVSGLLLNLQYLTANHLLLYQRYRQFGTADQKKDMERLIFEQVDSVNNSLSALMRFSGNLTLFDSKVGGQTEIDAELKLINQGLQEAMKEITHA
jgi:hypothetical protein